MGGTLAGASILELAYHRAAWARAAADPESKLFDIEKVADGIYFAQARPQAMINCNASVYVGAKDVVVVDAHSKPSAATSLIGQIKREITEKPVRYVINTHFHWDHTQGNHAYRAAKQKIDFIASATTKQLMSDFAVARLKASIGLVPKEVEALRARAARAASPQEKDFCAEQIRQLEAYQAELKNYSLELPTITFEKSYVLHDTAHDLHLEFRGHAHTAGDVVVFCPQKRVVSTGDMIHGLLPFIADGFPRVWPGTIQSVGQLEFTKVLPGHASLQDGHTIMTNMGNYIEELTAKVEEGRKAGLTVADMQKRITVAFLKSLHSNGYGDYITRNTNKLTPHFGNLPPLQTGVNTNIGEIYSNLDRV
jgi:glyoxylase-like metal-dependent hydrolase (beta-lactamase superfamily II)